jgi:hypothetical protein
MGGNSTKKKTAKKSDPRLWEKVKKEVTRSEKGGNAGQWSARKAQMATQEYKARGGGYEGPRQEDTHLHQWTREEWDTKSGRKSGESGERYLPRKAREALSKEEYDRTTAKKRADTGKGKQHSSQPKDIARKTARHRGNGPTKAELYEQAKKRDIPGRSRMSKAQLEKALG